MLAMIGDFEFTIDGTSFESFEKNLDLKFATHERLGNFNLYQNVGKYEEDINIKGTLVVKSQRQLDAFEVMAKRKEAVTLTLGNGTASTILIKNLRTIKDTFLKDGLFLKQSYTISLQVVQDDNN